MRRPYKILVFHTVFLVDVVMRNVKRLKNSVPYYGGSKGPRIPQPWWQFYGPRCLALVMRNSRPLSVPEGDLIISRFRHRHCPPLIALLRHLLSCRSGMGAAPN